MFATLFFIVINIISYIACILFGMKPKPSHIISCIFQNLCQTIVYLIVDEDEKVPLYIEIPFFLICSVIPLYFWIAREDKVKKGEKIFVESQLFPVYFPLISKKPTSIKKLKQKIVNEAKTPSNPYVKYDVEMNRFFGLSHPMPYMNMGGAFGYTGSVVVGGQGFADTRYIKYQSWQEDGEVPKIDKGCAGPIVAVFDRKVTLEYLDQEIVDEGEKIFNENILDNKSKVDATIVGFNPKSDRTIWAVQIHNKAQKIKASVIRFLGAALLVSGMPLLFEVLCHLFLKTVVFESKKTYSAKTTLRALNNKNDDSAVNADD